MAMRVDVALVLSRVVSWTDKLPDEATLAVAEEILIRLLEDSRRRTGMSGGIGDLSYRDPRVCDLAAEALRLGWPDRYEFDFHGPVKARNRQCIAAVNLWR
jgi:hypothetical protein